MNSLSLYQLNQTIKESLHMVIPTTLWVRAEINSVSTNYSGHCYLDLIEKHPDSDQIIAKQRATIWASTYRLLLQKFQLATNSTFQVGMKILVEVSVEFHELYGLSLNVKDIDPIYTLGELQRRRLEIIERLKKRGLIGKNSQLPLPRPIQRIAVISSPTAAGYTDFLHQLNNNPYGFQYSVTLFPAVMQGTQTEESILSALDIIKRDFEQSEKLTSVCSVDSVSKNISVESVQNSPHVCRNARLEHPQANDEGVDNFQLFIAKASKTFGSTFNFQLVVIIRGGGATSDLQAFDSERLAECCANFPLPIITGIGHHRDETILDMVAHTALKTPTAVAEFIISSSLEVLNFLDEMAEKMQNSVIRRIEQEKNYLLLLSTRLPQSVQRTLTQSVSHLTDLQHRLQLKTVDLIVKNRTYIDQKNTQLFVAINSLLQSQQSHLKLLETKLQLLDPQQLLKKGYSFTTHNGKLVTSITQLHSGDTITTTLTDGTIDSIIK